MADMAPETNFVKRPSYPTSSAKPKTAKRAPAAAVMTGFGDRATKADKSPEPMMIARMLKVAAGAMRRR